MVAVFSQVERFKQAQAQGQFFLAFQDRGPLPVVFEQFFGLRATLGEELFEHGGRGRPTCRKFRPTHDVFGQASQVSRLSKGGFLFSTCTTFPFCWQRVGSRSVVAAQERDTHLEGVRHGVAVNQPELKIAQLAVFQLKIEHGLQVARDGFRVVSS